MTNLTPFQEVTEIIRQSLINSTTEKKEQIGGGVNVFIFDPQLWAENVARRLFQADKLKV